MKSFVYHVDSFISDKALGNPTVVVMPESIADTEGLQAISKSADVPVTAFLADSDENFFDIRYFTCTTEIPACGHATLAAAAVIFETRRLSEAVFRTTEGIKLSTVLNNGLITMEYPKYGLRPYTVSQEMKDALKIGDFVNAGICTELETVFVEIENGTVLRNLAPDFEKLVESDKRVKEVVVTSRSNDPGHDFLLRSFCPWIGIDEDPVTGSVHSVLAGYWATRLGKLRLVAFQASQRGGELIITEKSESVEIGGKAFISQK